MSPSEDRFILWNRLLTEQKSSGLSVSSWCQERSISVNTFSYWRKRLHKPATAPAEHKPAPAGWVAVRADHSSPAGSLTLRIGSVSLDVATGFDRQLLRDVLGVLEARC